MKKLFILICFTLAISVVSAQSSSKSISDRIESVSGLVAYWDFSDDKDNVLLSEYGEYRLRYSHGEVPRIMDEGPLSGHSVYFDGSDFLYIPYSETGKLNVKTNAVTVVAWVKWTGEQTGFIGGMWDGNYGGGKRQ